MVLCHCFQCCFKDIYVTIPIFIYIFYCVYWFCIITFIFIIIFSFGHNYTCEWNATAILVQQIDIININEETIYYRALFFFFQDFDANKC